MDDVVIHLSHIDMSTSFKESVTVRLPEDLIAEVEAEANAQQSKKSEIIRRALRAHFDGLKMAKKGGRK